MYKFTIPIHPITKKNNPRIFHNGNKTIVLPSKAYEKFENDCLKVIPSKYRIKIDYPVNVKVIYYVKTKRRIDKTNLESAIMDVLVKAGVLADDSAISPDIVVSTDGSRVLIDKLNPRIEIEITKNVEKLR